MPRGRAEAGITGVDDMVGARGSIFHGLAGGMGGGGGERGGMEVKSESKKNDMVGVGRGVL